MSKDKVAIILSTYNGETYLSDQLDSILHQSYQDFRVYCRDDGSSDGTQSLLEKYATQSSKIVLFTDELGNVGVAKSFEILMKQTEADLYFFADQDDLWEPNKLDVLCAKAEAHAASNEPYLLFSNMTIFTETAASQVDFFEKYKVDETKVKNGLFQGTISGCLMVFNDSAKKCSFALNAESNMLHDWNIFLSTYLFGTIELVPLPLVKHRIHGANAIGENTQKRTLILVKDFLKYCCNSAAYRKIFLEDYFNYVDQIVAHLPEELRLSKELYTMDEVKNLGYFKRKKWYLKHFNPFIYGSFKGLLITLTV